MFKEKDSGIWGESVVLVCQEAGVVAQQLSSM